MLEMCFIICIANVFGVKKGWRRNALFIKPCHMVFINLNPVIHFFLPTGVITLSCKKDQLFQRFHPISIRVLVYNAGRRTVFLRAVYFNSW